MIRRLINKFRRDERGLVAVELAVAIPVLLTLIVSGVEITRYVVLNQKLDRAAATMADLVAQAESLSEGDLEILFTATRYVMEPFDIQAKGSAVVSSISKETSTAPKVNWKRTYGGGSGCGNFGSQGSAANLPSGLIVRDGESIVVTEICYEFTPTFTDSASTARTLYSYSVFRPRFSGLTKIYP